jgi:tryptophanyl-tRNA synthetase
MKPALISGVQPSGQQLHIGNYLGALKNFVDLQNLGRYQYYFMIADLHSLTEDFTPKEKARQILNIAADYIAAGINPKKSVVFLQSQVPAHTELAWVLGTLTPFGELRRMTQFKDKSEHAPQNVNVGLFSYPILMAADILLYDPKYIPVGDDQLQHLELTRTIVRRFNTRFGKTFVEPQPLLTETPRVMALDDPTKKMSKSRPKGCIFLSDSPEEIRSKIMHAVTDSESVIQYDPLKKPAISNLLSIYAAFSNQTVLKTEKKFSGKNYADLKRGLADLITDYFTDFRKKKTRLLKNPEQLKRMLRGGAKKASKKADQKMAEVKAKIGLAI